MTVITTIEDLRVLAQKRVPRMFYDYADSGSWTESTYRANSDDFQKIKLRQRVAVNMENRSTATRMVGQAVKMPVASAEAPILAMLLPSRSAPIMRSRMSNRLETTSASRLPCFDSRSIEAREAPVSAVSLDEKNAETRRQMMTMENASQSMTNVGLRRVNS